MTNGDSVRMRRRSVAHGAVTHNDFKSLPPSGASA